MKKNIIHRAVLIVLALSAFAARAQSGNIEISETAARLNGDRMELSLIITASGLKISSAEEYAVDFILRAGDREVILPEVLYSGWQRHYFDLREDEFSTGEKNGPYHRYTRVKKEQSHRLEYKLSLPYSPWMDDASLTCREFRRNSEKIQVGESLLAGIIPLEKPEPEAWAPDLELIRRMVYFISPEVGSGKHRTAVLEIAPDYPNNGTALLPRHGGNAEKLNHVDRLLRPIFENGYITVDSILLTGYGSPDGTLQVNEAVTQKRAESFRDYLTGTYGDYDTRINCVPEDWNGVKAWVENTQLTQKQNILSVVSDPEISPEEKESILKHFEYGNIWKQMRTQLFPELRRIKIEADYTISAFTDEQLCELIFILPELIGAEELFRAAGLFEPAGREYLKIFDVATEQYPQLQTVWINAAAAQLSSGNLEKAGEYLRKTGESPEATINLGVYYYVAGDLEKAEQCFLRAREAGMEKAAQNLLLLKRKTEY